MPKVLSWIAQSQDLNGPLGPHTSHITQPLMEGLLSTIPGELSLNFLISQENERQEEKQRHVPKLRHGEVSDVSRRWLWSWAAWLVSMLDFELTQLEE